MPMERMAQARKRKNNGASTAAPAKKVKTAQTKPSNKKSETEVPEGHRTRSKSRATEAGPSNPATAPTKQTPKSKKKATTRDTGKERFPDDFALRLYQPGEAEPTAPPAPEKGEKPPAMDWATQPLYDLDKSITIEHMPVKFTLLRCRQIYQIIRVKNLNLIAAAHTAKGWAASLTQKLEPQPYEPLGVAAKILHTDDEGVIRASYLVYQECQYP